MPQRGIKPATLWLLVRHLTNWATLSPINNSVLQFLSNSLECRYQLHLLMGSPPAEFDYHWHAAWNCGLTFWPPTDTHIMSVWIPGWMEWKCTVVVGSSCCSSCVFLKNKFYIICIWIDILGLLRYQLSFFEIFCQFIDTGGINDSPRVNLSRVIIYKYDMPVGCPPGITSPREDCRSRA